jgi:catechol 2,3-dioxygenase-like lactoylglutathione lyase family enzyme
MNAAGLEHINITSMNAERTADALCSMFGWRVRWQGPSAIGGESIHVGTDEAYVAIYSPPEGQRTPGRAAKGRLNHIGVVVDDLDAAERRVIEAGYKPHSHAAYEPGRRFYFTDDEGIEFEVVSFS